MIQGLANCHGSIFSGDSSDMYCLKGWAVEVMGWLWGGGVGVCCTALSIVVNYDGMVVVNAARDDSFSAKSKSIYE